jgi:hypothetical protein
LLGDDYQHLLTWLHAAQLVHRDPTVTRVELEKYAAGNVDDLVVHRRDRPALYHQVKFTTQPGTPLTGDWFIDTAGGGTSPLKRFYESFTRLTIDGTPPEMVLHTNRLPATNDPMLSCLDGTTELLVPKLARATPGSAAGKARAHWSSHLDIAEDELITLLASLRLRAAQAGLNDLQERCRWVMDAVGMVATRETVDKGMLAARRWIETGVREVHAGTIDQLVDAEQMRAADPVATVLIQAIDHDLWPETATIDIDWVDAFKGAQPSERREPRTPGVWMQRFAPDLRDAAERMRTSGFSRVRIDGAFRLATAIYAGTVFSDVRGFQLRVPGRSGDGTWIGDISSDGPQQHQTLTRIDHTLGQGDELAVGVCVSGDLTAGVLRHARNVGLPVERLAVLSLLHPARDALASPPDVRGWATAATTALRALADDGWPRVHLFFYGPRTAAVLLGHQWNRMVPTQLWDDLGAGRGYTAAFALAAT